MAQPLIGLKCAWPIRRRQPAQEEALKSFTICNKSRKNVFSRINLSSSDLWLSSLFMEGIFCLEQWIRQGTASGDVSRVGGRGKKTDEGFTSLELNTKKSAQTFRSMHSEEEKSWFSCFTSIASMGLLCKKAAAGLSKDEIGRDLLKPRKRIKKIASRISLIKGSF